MEQIETPGPCIDHENTDTNTLTLDSLCVSTPDGSRQVCKASIYRPCTHAHGNFAAPRLPGRGLG